MFVKFTEVYGTFSSTADYKNENEVGEGIEKAIQKKLVSRSELFVTTKVRISFSSNYRDFTLPNFFVVAVEL